MAFVNACQLLAAPPDRITDPLVALATDGAMVSILDANSLLPIRRFETRSVPRGAPAFTGDARYALIATADGWVVKLDLVEHRVAAESRVSAATKTLVLSGDDRFVAVASDSPPALIVLDAMALSPIKIIPVEGGTGLRALATAASRQSFIAAPAGVAELWEVSYSDNPPYRGWVHDYRDDGIPAERPRFPVRRIEQRDALDAIAFGDSHDYVFAASSRSSSLHIIDLYIGRRFAEVPLPGQPRLAASVQWATGAGSVLAIPDPTIRALHLVDLKDWREAGRIATPSAAYSVNTHPSIRDAWVSGDAALHIVEKTKRAVRQTIAIGRPVTNIDFDRQGRRAIVSADGLLLVYDTDTLAELTRAALPGPARVYSSGRRAAQ